MLKKLMTINNNFNILDLDGDQGEVVSSNSSKQNSLMLHSKNLDERHWEGLCAYYKIIKSFRGLVVVVWSSLSL